MNIGLAIAIGVGGLLLGLLLNPLITRMATDPDGANPLVPARYALLGGPTWVGLAVAALMSAMAVVLYGHYGLGPRWLFWVAGSAVLIIIGAVDWKVRLIDVLFVLVATLITLILSVWFGVGWQNALLGALGAGIIFIFFFMLARFMFPGPGVPFGLGDVYLALYIGALIGLTNLPYALFYGMAMAGVAALAVLVARQMGSKHENYISYGTFLCLGTLLYLAIYKL